LEYSPTCPQQVRRSVSPASDSMWTPAPPAATLSLGLYEQAMTRIIHAYIEDRLILKKPSGQHHNGNLITGFNISLTVGASDCANCDMFANRIAEGSVCGLVGP
jgi:hypothetical protein